MPRVKSLFRYPHLPRKSSAPRIAILGAGAGGLGLAIRLRQAGITSFSIFDKADGVGGTWRANTYPGAACDVPSHLYSFSFARRRNWSRKFATQPEILDYFEGLVKDFDLSSHLRLNTEIVGAVFSDTTNDWTITLASGAQETFSAVVFACGQLNRPFIPNFIGQDNFSGPAFHSAQWDHEVDLSGLNVGVIGTGASAIQFVPSIAEQVKSLTIFQRTPAWVVPRPDREFTAQERKRFIGIPGWQWLYRASIYWRLEFRWWAMKSDSRMSRYIEGRIRPELEKIVQPRLDNSALIPDYPIGCKRLLMANDWYPTILRDNVEVVTESIAQITPDGVITADNQTHCVDALIFGTGFSTTEFLAPVEVVGQKDLRLRDAWREGSQAHLGVTVPNFPNLFVIYGPNTNLGHNSILFMIEQQIRLIVGLLVETASRDAKWVTVRDEVAERSDRDLQGAAKKTVWVTGCDNWYTDEKGRLTNNWPFPTVVYWWRTRFETFRDYVFGGTSS